MPHSSKAIKNEPMKMTLCSSGRFLIKFGVNIELGGHAFCLLDLAVRSLTLLSDSIPSEEAPPAFLEVEAASPCWDEDAMEVRVPGHQVAGLGTVMAAEITRETVDVAPWVIGFNVLIGLHRDIPVTLLFIQPT